MPETSYPPILHLPIIQYRFSEPVPVRVAAHNRLPVRSAGCPPTRLGPPWHSYCSFVFPRADPCYCCRVLLFIMASSASPRSNPPTSPLEVSEAQESTTISTQDATEEDDLDPAAFLKSVRELTFKRECEDRARYKKLEEDIELGRQQRLARRAGE